MTIVSNVLQVYFDFIFSVQLQMTTPVHRLSVEEREVYVNVCTVFFCVFTVTDGK